MKKLRWFIRKCLPSWWSNRIDIEGAEIRKHIAHVSYGLSEGLLILDAGAGESPYSSYFKNSRIIAVDFGRGEKSWNYLGLDVVGMIEKLPFRESSFDAVLSTQVLEHVCEPSHVLQEAHRVLKNDGLLILTAPLGFGEHQQPYDYYRYTRYGLRYLLQKAGFKSIDIHPRGGYFKYLAVMVMWIYLLLFPDQRKKSLKLLLFPLQAIAAFIFVLFLPPLISLFDPIDHEQSITLGWAVTARK